METLYGVLGMMAVIVVIAVALVRAPRRSHAWEKNDAPRRPPRALRTDRWRLREQDVEAIRQGSMVSELATVTRRNAEEAEWVARAKEMKAAAARAATVTAETLRDLEEYARVADELTDRKDDPQAVIDAGVKRRFLIVQLAAFSLLDPAERELGDSLERRGFTRLSSLHRAACKLADYLASDVRAELVGVRAPEPAVVAVLSAPFSLDLFHRRTLLAPTDLSPNRALAQAEAELLWNPESGGGSFLFVKAGGFRYEYTLRIEDGIRTVVSGVAISRV
jgi:hypothetical protein